MFKEKGAAAFSSQQSGTSKVCMCVVCTCGQHKCPSRETCHYDKSIQSEYGERFPEWPVSKRAPHRPPACKKGDGPFDGTTTHKTDFQKWAVIPRKPMKPPTTNEDTGPFVDVTTYKVDFWDKSKEQKPSRRVERPHKVDTGAFYDETTYGVGFCPKQLPKRCIPDKHGSSLGSSGAPFVDETTYNVGFKDWKVKRPVRGSPLKSSLEGPPQRFEGDTTYHHDFTCPPPVKRCPVLLRPKPSCLVDNHLCY